MDNAGHNLGWPPRAMASVGRCHANTFDRLGLFPKGIAASEGKDMIKILYFAWVRERIGGATESIETEATTVAELIAELRQKEPRYDMAFSDLSALRVAVDQNLTDFNHPLAEAKEVAFFPPMTGG